MTVPKQDLSDLLTLGMFPLYFCDLSDLLTRKSASENEWKVVLGEQLTCQAFIIPLQQVFSTALTVSALRLTFWYDLLRHKRGVV